MMLFTIACVGLLSKFSLLNSTGIRVGLSLVMASMGGFLSMSIGIKSLQVDHREQQRVNTFNGCLRIVIAMISGAAAYLLVDSRIVLSDRRQFHFP